MLTKGNDSCPQPCGVRGLLICVTVIASSDSASRTTTMRQMKTVPAMMAIVIDAQPETLTTNPLPTPQWQPRALWQVLRARVASLTRRRTDKRQDIRPDFPRQETPIDILARKHTFLYACSMAG